MRHYEVLMRWCLNDRARQILSDAGVIADVPLYYVVALAFGSDKYEKVQGPFTNLDSANVMRGTVDDRRKPLIISDQRGIDVWLEEKNSEEL